MELVYAFDENCFWLGQLCKHGHAWPGSGQSLRRINLSQPALHGECVGCVKRDSGPVRHWLIPFIDNAAMGFEEHFALSTLCARGHKWQGLDLSLRYQRRCLECDRVSQRRKENRKEQKSRRRDELRKQGLTARGAAPLRADGAQPQSVIREQAPLMAAIKKAGSAPSVAKLVYIQQQNYWRENPQERNAYCRKHNTDRRWLRYQLCSDARLYDREKSKRRKAQMRKLQTVDKVSVVAIRKRFAEFGNCCAYCGSGGDMQIEHVKPIAAGGAHAIYNIVPACAFCNSSKSAREMSEWYQAQPFFDELRMRRIQRATCPPPPQQLALALA